MTNKEIEKHRQELTNILKGKDSGKRDKLKDLAIRVGTSTYHWGRVGGEDEATESQLVFNIQTALQTASMIDACRTSAKNYEAVLIATKAAIQHYKITAAIAILAMLAAYVAAFINK